MTEENKDIKAEAEAKAEEVKEEATVVEDAAKEAAQEAPKTEAAQDAAKADASAETAKETAKETTAEDTTPPIATSKEIEKVLPDFDADQEAEKICRWGAARAGAIVITPLLGSIALMANEVYMITRLSDLYGVELTEGAIAGLVGALGASFVGQTLFTIIPFPPLQIPVAVSITYGVGKAAQAWLKAGNPNDLAQFKEIYEQARKEGLAKFKELSKLAGKDKPLGDESKRFNFKEKAAPIIDKFKDQADDTAEKVETALAEATAFLAPYKEKGELWLTAQNIEALRKGGIIVPFAEIAKKMADAGNDGDFKFVACRYHEPKEVEVDVEHVKYGILRLVLGIEGFAINNEEGSVKFRVKDFSVLENSLAQFVIKALGTKLIGSIVNSIFSNKVLEKDEFTCVYADNLLSVDFTNLIKSNKYLQTQIKGKNVLDLVRFVDLVPQATGMLVQSKFTLENLKK